jgi:hypothetical protein
MGRLIDKKILFESVVTIDETNVLGGGSFTLVATEPNVAIDIISVVSLLKNCSLSYDGLGDIYVGALDYQYISDFVTVGAVSSVDVGIKFMDYNAAQGGIVSAIPNVFQNSKIQVQIPTSTIGNGSLTFYVLYRKITLK